MLGAKVIVNRGDWNRNRPSLTGPRSMAVPSTLALVAVTWSIRSLAQARSPASVPPTVGGVNVSHSPLMIGTRIALPGGTVQLRVAEPPVVPVSLSPDAPDQEETVPNMHAIVRGTPLGHATPNPTRASRRNRRR